MLGRVAAVVGLKRAHGATIQHILNQLLQLEWSVGFCVVKVRDDSRVDFGTICQADHVSWLIQCKGVPCIRGFGEYGSAKELSHRLGCLLGGEVVRVQ